MSNELVAAEQSIERLMPIAQELVRGSHMRKETLKFPNKDEFLEADKLYNEIHRTWKAGDDDRKSLTGPLNSVIDNINGRYKPLLDPLSVAKKTLKGAMDQYATDEMIWKRRENERIMAEKRKADEEALAAATRLAEEGKVKEADHVVAQAVATKPVAAVGATDDAQIFTKTEWRAEVVNIKEFLMGMASRQDSPLFVTVETGALNRYAKATKGLVPMAGVEFKEVSTVGARR